MLLAVFATLGAALMLQGCGPGGGSGARCAADGSDHIYTETIVGETRTISTSFCPNHPMNVINPNYAVSLDSAEAYKVPAKPKLMTTNVELNEQGGITGVFFSGAMVFSPYGGGRYGRVTNQANSATVAEGDTFDQCGCHSSSTSAPSYHCHVAPSCLLSQLNAQASAHSPQVGWAADGFPIYGPRGEGGKLIESCAGEGAEAPCADECGGILSETPADGYGYRYYMMGETKDGTTCEAPASEATPWPGSEEKYYPNVPVCYKGCCPAGAECSTPVGRFALRVCNDGAADGWTQEPTVPHPTGLGRYEGACWDDAVATQSAEENDKAIVFVGVAVGLLAVGAAVAVLYARSRRTSPHEQMTEMEEATQS